jgi:hypothetical protein
MMEIYAIFKEEQPVITWASLEMTFKDKSNEDEKPKRLQNV